LYKLNDDFQAIAWHPWKPSYLAIGGTESGIISLWNVNQRKEKAEYMMVDSSALVCSLEWSPLTGELVASIWVSGQ
jgi:WD40 repeat protein